MAERRRFRPEENATRFEEICGGLNKITLGRFRRIMDTSGLECRYFATNASDNPVVRTMKVVSHVPPLREYFTQGNYPFTTRIAIHKLRTSAGIMATREAAGTIPLVSSGEHARARLSPDRR